MSACMTLNNSDSRKLDWSAFIWLAAELKSISNAVPFVRVSSFGASTATDTENIIIMIIILIIESEWNSVGLRSVWQIGRWIYIGKK